MDETKDYILNDMAMNKRIIAVVAGGDSGEYEVSLRSAEGITSFLDKERYAPYTVIIRGTEWNVQLPDNTVAPIDRNDFSFVWNGEKVAFDYAYITIHGTPGENGLLGSYFELIRMPYSTIFPELFLRGALYHFALDQLHLLLHPHQICIGAAEYVLHRKPCGESGNLGNQTQLFIGIDIDFAVVIVHLAGEDVEQGGLAAAVPA